MSFFQRPSSDALRNRLGPHYKWLLLGVVGLGTVAGVLSTSSFNVAITALGEDFGLSQERVQWTVTGFMLAMTLAMLPASWLLDRFGFRKVFLASVTLLTVTSLTGSLANNFALVVFIRVLQGVAAGVLQPLSMLLVLRLFPIEVQGRASGVLTLGLALTPAVAPAFGGMLIDRFGWPAIFLLNLPFSVAALLLGLCLLPAPREIKRHRFDWLGVSSLSASTLCLVEAVASLQHSGLFSPWTLTLLLAAIVLLYGYIRHARRHPQPIISLGLFGQRTFSMGAIVSFSYGFGLYGSTYLIPLFLQSALGYSAAAAGSALIPGGLALVLTTPLAGRLADRYPPKRVTIAGLLLFGLSFLLFAALGGDIRYTGLIITTVLGRVGLGLILPALNLATLRHLETHQLAQSSVVVSYARQLGGVLGVAIIAVFVEWRALTATSTTSPYVQAFCLLGLSLLLAIGAASLMRHRERAPG